MTYLMSLLSIAMIWLMGNKWKHAPLIGLINQILWFAYIFDRKEWGLLLMTIAYTVIHFRNWIKWRKL